MQKQGAYGTEGEWSVREFMGMVCYRIRKQRGSEGMDVSGKGRDWIERTEMEGHTA